MALKRFDYDWGYIEFVTTREEGTINHEILDTDPSYTWRAHFWGYDRIGPDTSYLGLAQYDGSVTYQLVNPLENTDGSVTVSAMVTIDQTTRTFLSNPPAGESYNYNWWSGLDGTETWSYVWANGTSGALGTGVQTTRSVTVPASGEAAFGIWRFSDVGDSPQGVVQQDLLDVRIRVVNTSTGDYRPGSVMVAGVERSCNRSGGMFSRMVNGVETELRTLDGHAQTGNPPSIIDNGQEVNQEKAGQE